MLLECKKSRGGSGPVERLRGRAEESQHVLETVGVKLRIKKRQSVGNRTLNGLTTDIDAVDLFILVVSAIRERHALAAEHQAIGEETEKDRLWEIHDRLPVHLKTPAAKIKEETGEQLRLEIGMSRRCMLRDLCYGRRRHGEGTKQAGAGARDHRPFGMYNYTTAEGFHSNNSLKATSFQLKKALYILR